MNLDLFIIKEIINEMENNNNQLNVIIKVLEKYLHADEIIKILDIGKTTYYNYKRTGSTKYVDRKLYKFYQSIKY